MYLSEDQIEFIADKTTSDLKNKLNRGEISLETYQDELACLAVWADGQRVTA